MSNKTYFIDYTKCLAKKNIKSSIIEQCPNSKKYGHFCGKHKNYASKGYKKIDELIYTTNVTNEDYETKNKKCRKCPKKLITLEDYYLDNHLKRFSNSLIIKTLKQFKLVNTTADENKKRLINLFFMIDMGKKHLNKLIFLQDYIMYYLKKNKKATQGPGYINRNLCNNTNDFYSFDNLNEIDEKYFFSYKCSDNFIYGFHIESFIELINNSNSPTNPYNRNLISQSVKTKAKQIWINLKKKNKCSKEIRQIISNDIRIRVKTKIISVLQKMDLFGYQTNINWVYNLTLNKSKLLYRQLLNYWHYKAGFTNETRLNIYPNENTEPLFSDSISRKITRVINKYIVMDITMDIINKLISSGPNDDDKNKGCIMVLMAISEVSRECAESNSWLL